MKNNQSLLLVILVAACLFLYGCSPSSTPAPTIAPSLTATSEPTATLTSTPTPKPTLMPTATPIPVNAKAIDDLVDLTAQNAILFEKVADLWPTSVFVSRMAVYPGTNRIVLGTGSSYSMTGGTTDPEFIGLTNDTKIVLWDPITNLGKDAFETGVANIDPLSNSQPLYQFDGVAVSPDGRRIAFVGDDLLILGSLSNAAADGNLTFTSQEIPLDEIKGGPDLGAVFSSDSRLLAIARESGSVLIWDVQANRKLAVYNTAPNPQDPECYAFTTKGVFFTKDNQSVISSCGQQILFTDLNSLKITPFQIQTDPFVIALSPQGDSLVTGERVGDVDVWKFPSGELQTKLTGHDQEITGLAFTSDGNLLATSCQDGIVDVWDTHTWRRLASFEAPANFLAFSADNRLLVTGTHIQGGALWGVKSGSLTAKRSGVKVTVSGNTTLDAWKGDIPTGWFAPEGTLPRYEIHIGSPTVSEGICPYTNSFTVFRQRFDTVIQITDLETGETVEEKTFQGSPSPECPKFWSASPGTSSATLFGDGPETGPILVWLKKVMAPLGFQ